MTFLPFITHSNFMSKAKGTALLKSLRIRWKYEHCCQWFHVWYVIALRTSEKHKPRIINSKLLQRVLFIKMLIELEKSYFIVRRRCKLWEITLAYLHHLNLFLVQRQIDTRCRKKLESVTKGIQCYLKWVQLMPEDSWYRRRPHP